MDDSIRVTGRASGASLALVSTDQGAIVVFEDVGGDVRIDVRMDGETVWLNLSQIAELFARDKSVISRHLRNVFESGELEREAVVARNATTGSDGKTYQVEYFNLDAILSVGYRVNSRRGTRFRIWATRTLREHLVRGFTLNERRLREKGLSEAEQTMRLLARTLSVHALVNEQGQAVLDVVGRYARTWRLLLEYDEERLAGALAHPTIPTATLAVDDARVAIGLLKETLVASGQASALFARERDESLAAILGSLEQTFDREPLYPGVEARAAHLLYFIIKDHPFVDGNKRTASFLFLRYLDLNGVLTRPDGMPRFDANGLVAAALLIAESDPAQKDLMIRLILNLLAD